MTALRTLLFVSAVVALAACSKLTESNLEKVHNGMSTDEVKTLLGEPNSTDSSGALGITGTTYTYHTSTSDVKITFLNDKVIATQGDFK